MRIRVIGGGLAGPEAALTAARLGCEVDLYEMRAMVDGKPRLTPAHQTTDFGELVCSNSLKSESPNTAPWLLKQEMRRAGSALLRIADETAVPAGHALAVDRVEFSRRIAEAIAAEPAHSRHPRRSHELCDVQDEDGTNCTILATGPLTSDALSARDSSASPARGTWRSTIPSRPSSMPKPSTWSAFTSPRAGTRAPPTTSTAPWIARSTTAFSMRCSPPKPPKPKSGRSSTTSRAACRSKILARRGRDTLRFGPMKPVGLRDPRTGKTPWAVVQLRKENLRADSYNLVGFQNHLKFGEQARVLRLIPGLENARFLRYGQIHRNTYICAPALLDRKPPLETLHPAAVRRPDSPASRATPSPSPPACSPASMQHSSRAATSPCRCRAPLRSAR